MKPSISVVIATRNEEDTIGGLVESIKAQTYPAKEILVIDGYSTDSTRDVAEKAGAVVIPETGEKRSPSNAWNIGLNIAKGDTICFLGGDFLMDNNLFLEKSIDAFSEKDVVATYALVCATKDTFFRRITAIDGKSIQPMLIRKEVLKEIGCYPTIGAGEEIVLVKRLNDYIKRYGKKTVYVKDAILGGYPVGSFGELFWQGEWYGRTLLKFLKVCVHELGFKSCFKYAIEMSLRPLYALSLIPAAYYAYGGSFIFTLPFLSLMFFTIIKNTKHPPHMLKVFTNIVYGYGYLYGLFSYLLGTNRGVGRK